MHLYSGLIDQILPLNLDDYLDLVISNRLKLLKKHNNLKESYTLKAISFSRRKKPDKKNFIISNRNFRTLSVCKQIELFYINLFLLSLASFNLIQEKSNARSCLEQALKNEDFLPVSNFNQYIIGIELIINNPNGKTVICGTKMLKILCKKFGFHTILLYLGINMNIRNKIIQEITSISLSLVIKIIGFSKIFPFFRSLLVYKKNWHIKFSMCKTIQKIVKTLSLLPYECESVFFLSEKCIRIRKVRIQLEAVKIIFMLSKNHNLTNSAYLPCLILPILNRLRSNKQPSFLVFLILSELILKIYIVNIPSILVYEIIEITLQTLVKKNRKYQLGCLKILKLCLQSKISETKLIKYKAFISLTIFFPLAFQLSYTSEIHFILIQLISLCKRKIKKKLLFFFLNKLSGNKFQFRNIFLRLIKDLLLYLEKDKQAFIILLKVFQITVKVIYHYSKKKKTLFDDISVKICHTILDSIVKNFRQFRGSLLSRITGVFKWELKQHKSILRQQASRSIKSSLVYFENLKKKNIISQIGFTLFENLQEKEPDILADIILGLNSVIQAFKSEYCIPPLDFLLLEITPILKIRHKIVNRNLTKLISNILDKKFLYLPKEQWICIVHCLIDLSKKYDFLTKKYSVCSICKIGKIIGPSKIINILRNFYFRNTKIQSSVFSILLVSFSKVFGSQFAISFFHSIFNCKYSNISFLELKTMVYIMWCLPDMKVKPYFNILITILENFSEQEKKKKPCSFYTLLGLFAKKTKNMGFVCDLNTILTNVWSDVFQSDKFKFRYILFAIEKICIITDNVNLTLFLSQGLFHQSAKVRAIYWDIHTIFENKIKWLFNFIFIFDSNRKYKPR
nr:splicing factor 3B subunit 1-like protein [Cryptomonas sp.]